MLRLLLWPAAAAIVALAGEPLARLMRVSGPEPESWAIASLCAYGLLIVAAAAWSDFGPREGSEPWGWPEILGALCGLALLAPSPESGLSLTLSMALRIMPP